MNHTKLQKATSRPFTRRDFLSTSLKVGAAAFTPALLPNLRAKTEGKYNVLFIMVDDLRPLLGCYGHSEMHTPNIDRLAQRGIIFNQAYCQFPVCNPSRASMLTGLRPETTSVLDNSTNFRETVPEAVTLPQHFKAHGYYTRSIGKILHDPLIMKDTLSWSEPIWMPRTLGFQDVPSWNALDVDDDGLEDGEIAKHTVDVLNEVKDKVFFLQLVSSDHIYLFTHQLITLICMIQILLKMFQTLLYILGMNCKHILISHLMKQHLQEQK